MTSHHAYLHTFQEIARGINSPWSVIAALGTVLAAGIAAYSAWLNKQTRDDELIPVIVPQARGALSPEVPHMLLTLLNNNMGKGIAKEISVFIGNVPAEVNLGAIPGGSNDEVQIPAEDKKMAVALLLSQGLPTLPVRIKYKDIYERKYLTEARLQKETDAHGRVMYFLDRGWWRLHKNVQ